MNATIEKGFSQSNKQAMRNPWVLGLIAMIVIVLGVNIAFITTAFVTNPGLVNENYYEQGRSYEQELQRKLAARSELGWQLNFEVPENPRLGQPSSYRVVVADKLGRPLQGAQVTLNAFRPSNAKDDFGAEFREITAGVYETQLNFPLKGLWDLIVTVRQANGQYDLAQRINVQP